MQFGQWLATTRIVESRACKWHLVEEQSAGQAEATVRSGRGSNTVYVALQHMKNHVWRELWPAMPADARQYWHWVTRRVMGIFDGGGGGMRQEAEKAGREAGRAAAQTSVARGEGVEQQQAASAKASADMTRQVEAKLRAGTTRPCTKQHLFQAGEYLLQDAHLSEPFEVNVAFSMSAYVCLARQTGCRPGMTMNDADDLANTTSHWCAPTASGTRRHGGVEGARGPAGRAPVAMRDTGEVEGRPGGEGRGREATRRTRVDTAGGVSASPLTPSPDARCGRHEVPPLRMSDLRIDMDNELGGAQTEGAFRALCRMQVTFKRKKGEYFAHYAFGTSITPDSDQMLRIGTLALLRLLLRCGSFRGCYARLSRADAAALRKKVADPRGFAGLELEDTGHESFLSLVRACREDSWVLDEAALSRPLFPAVDTATGRFLFTESFQVKTVCDLLIQTGVSLGMNRHQVGAWSLGRTRASSRSLRVRARWVRGCWGTGT